MAKRKVYDDKFRASAVVMLEAAGYPENKFKLAEVAKHLGIPSRSLRRWFLGENGAPPDDVVTQQKKALADRLEELAHKILDTAMIAAGDDEASIQMLVTSLGIVLDKRQLLRGKPTSIVDDASLTDETRVDRIIGLLDAARTRRDGRAAGAADADGG